MQADANDPDGRRLKFSVRERLRSLCVLFCFVLYRICVEQNVDTDALSSRARSFALFPSDYFTRCNLTVRGVGFVQWRVAWYIAGADGTLETDRQTGRPADMQTGSKYKTRCRVELLRSVGRLHGVAH